MPISDQLLEILCCPKTKSPVKMASADVVAAANAAIAAGGVNYADESAVDTPLEEALVTDDGATLYRIDGGIPVMLIERAIATGQF